MSEQICGICYKAPENAKLLFCQHIFCLKCLRNHLCNVDQSVRKDGVICPLCNIITSLNVKTKKGFHFNSSQKASSKKLSIITNLDTLLPSAYPPNTTNVNAANYVTVPGDGDVISPFHHDLKSQSSSIHNPCRCAYDKEWICTTCHERFCMSCISNHLEKPLPGQMCHDIFNPTLCIYCLRPKKWQCITCDKPLCSDCIPNHLDKYNNHEVDVSEQDVPTFESLTNVTLSTLKQGERGHSSFSELSCFYCKTVKTWQCTSCGNKPLCSNCLPKHLDTYIDHNVENIAEQNMAALELHLHDESSLTDPIPSAPIYYPSNDIKNKVKKANIYQDPSASSNNDVKPKYEIDGEYRPPPYYEALNKKFTVLSFNGTAPPPLPSRPAGAIIPATTEFPSEVRLVLKLSESNIPKKFCMHSGEQIFILFIENDKEVFKYDLCTGKQLCTINIKMNIHDISYNERNNTLLVLSSQNNSAASSNNYFLQEYNVFNSELMDVFKLGNEDCKFVVADKRNGHRAYITMQNKIQTYNFVTRTFERNIMTCKSSMPDMSLLIAMEPNEKGSHYLLFSNHGICSLFAFHTLPVPVHVPLPILNDVQDIVISRSNVICFADPQTHRVLLFGKGPNKEFVQIDNEICAANKYTWKPRLLHICDDELLIFDIESKSLYSWHMKFNDRY